MVEFNTRSNKRPGVDAAWQILFLIERQGRGRVSFRYTSKQVIQALDLRSMLLQSS